MKVTRRNFLGMTAGAGAYALSPLNVQAQPAFLSLPEMEWPPNRPLPSFARPVSLDAADVQQLTSDQQVLMTTLQGIVNRRQPRIYLFLSGDNTDQTWLNTIEIPNTIATDPLSLVQKYRNEVSGAVVYDPNVPDTINLATSLAGIMGGVAASSDLAGQYQYPVLLDLRGRFSDKFDAYNWLIDNYWPQLTPRLLTAISPGAPNLRDYIVATRSLVFWLDPEVPNEAALFAQILQKVAPNTPYLGWFANGNEDAGVQLCSQNGVVVGAADYLNNATVLGGVGAAVRPFQPYAPPPALENRIYLTLTMSDGDNLQYDEHRLRTIWDDPNRGKVPLNWSISPFLLDVAPAVLNYYQSTQTPNDFLVAGPSGAGYTYPGDWPSADLPIFTRRTGEYMDRTGMNVIYALNRLNGNNIDITEAVAQDYASSTRLAGILGNWVESKQSGYVTTPAGLPVVTQVGISTVAQGQALLAAAAQSWNGASPRFIALGLLAWDMTPTDVITLASSLGASYEVVRADVFFGLLRETLGLS